MTRGALPEAEADGVNYPGTYVAGLYDRAQTEIAGRTVENEDLVNVPNWLPLRFRVAGGEWFDAQRADVREHRLELDMRRGTLTRHLVWQDAGGRRTRVTQRRFVSMKDEHLAGLDTTFTAENWSGTLEVSSGLDGRVVNAGVKRYRDLNGRHLRVLGQAAGRRGNDRSAGGDPPVARAGRPGRRAPGCCATGGSVEADRRLVEEPGFVAHELSFELEKGTPGDRGEGRRAVHLQGPGDLREPRRRPADGGRRRGLRRAAGPPRGRVEQPLEPLRHRAGQRQRVDRDRPAPAHLPSAADGLTPHAAPGRRRPGARLARGGLPGPHLLGRDVHLPVPQLRAADPGQRAAGVPPRAARGGPARRPGRPGTTARCSPGRAAPTDGEETQEVHLNPKSGRWLPDHSHNQRHVNIAIAYNVWQHYMVTGSTAFLRFTGAELLVEIARFWASIATYELGAGPLRDPRRHGSRRVPRGLPGLRRAGAAQQHLYQRHGGLGAAAGARGAGRSCRRTTGRNWSRS